MLLVNEIFYSIQGEGQWTETPAVFIRLMGCNVGCKFCDTKHTWMLDPGLEVTSLSELPVNGAHRKYAKALVTDLLRWIRENSPEGGRIVITGGEPLLQAVGVAQLCAALLLHGYVPQIETSGTIYNSALFHDTRIWMTVSPKWEGRLPVLPECLDYADEIKVVLSSESIVERIKHLPNFQNLPIRLQPETGSNYEWSLPRAIELCKEWKFPLSVQLHNILKIR